MSKKIVIYYSLGGNTKKIAEWIAKNTGADIFRIDTVKPYTGSYNDIVDQGQQEINNHVAPEIKPITVDFNKYDTVIIGTPVWWYTYVPAFKTFFSQVDLSDKKVYVFATNGGWIGHTFEDLALACKASKIKGNLNVSFSNKTLKTSEEKITSWIKEID